MEHCLSASSSMPISVPIASGMVRKMDAVFYCIATARVSHSDWQSCMDSAHVSQCNMLGSCTQASAAAKHADKPKFVLMLRQCRDEISDPACKSRVTKVKEVAASDIRFDIPLAEACYSDRQTFCANVQPGSARVIRCLQNRSVKPLLSCCLGLWQLHSMSSEVWASVHTLWLCCASHSRTCNLQIKVTLYGQSLNTNGCSSNCTQSLKHASQVAKDLSGTRLHSSVYRDSCHETSRHKCTSSFVNVFHLKLNPSPCCLAGVISYHSSAQLSFSMRRWTWQSLSTSRSP